MKCVILGGNVKILAKAIHMLAKIGDEMYVNPQQEFISFRTVNMAKSAYSDFTFHKNFFSYYALGDLEKEEAQKCKISMRSAMTLFKSAHAMDKHVETCHINLEPNACSLEFILKYRNGINKSHLSPILDDEKLQASYTKIGMKNELMSRARTLVDALQNFQSNLIEITLEVTPQKLLLRNYVDDTSGLQNTTRTQLVLSVGEFDRYIVENETVVTFCLKEFRAFLTFSESVGASVSAHFETAGKPVLFALKNHSLEVNLLLSTLSPDCDSQSDISVISRHVQSFRKKSTSRCKSSSRGNVKSAGRTKKSAANLTINNTSKKRVTEEINQRNKTPDRAEKDVAAISKTGDPATNNVRERSQAEPEQSHLFAISPASTTSSTTRRRIPESHRKLVNSVFSSITKRKSTSDNENFSIKEGQAKEFIDPNESIPRSPPRQPITKRARVVFQKCFQNTFDPRMLPGHDTILVEDSDENNSD
ncbi:PREDICTED: cell cycle checkpoint control protein RAD9A [Dinoponera quadriceps]|uniref:Cell cycle checkpoint control protein RAD9A n=1 Tax=Dinoponera quadriceps TaxID=609295 RepID=A0A6P3X080_DINQU|nr:PREDICTED: cell cycle checkpoint control protein RAD9A [Dinoponera quadriceps]